MINDLPALTWERADGKLFLRRGYLQMRVDETDLPTLGQAVREMFGQGGIDKVVTGVPKPDPPRVT